MQIEGNVLVTDHADLCCNDISFQNFPGLAHVFKSNMKYLISVKWPLLNFFVLYS